MVIALRFVLKKMTGGSVGLFCAGANDKLAETRVAVWDKYEFWFWIAQFEVRFVR